MDWSVVVVLQVMFQPSLSVLFTVDAERATYQSEFGGNVVMGCRFQPKLSDPNVGLKVTWHWLASSDAREVYCLDNGEERLATQHPDYRGRVKLLTEELKEGWAKIQVSRLRINDSGTYQCLVQTVEGADYKMITLSIIAPYTPVTKHIQKAAGGEEVLLTCQSEGYPESSVMWQDGHLRTLSSNTTPVSTPAQLYKVTSQIRVPSADKNNYTCSFAKDGHSATFHIPDELPVPHDTYQNNALIVVLSIGLIMLVIITAAFMHRRRKESCSPATRNLLAINEIGTVPTAAHCMGGNLGMCVKAHYCDFTLSRDARRHWDAFGAEERPHRLQNNEGQPVNLQALLPEAGETLFLEGPPGSGKTTVAHILVSSWTEGPTHALSTGLDLSALRLLVYVDCSEVKGDLLQEITTQLSLTEKTDELRAMLTGSSEALLLLDGYREGDRLFDESLRRFLTEREGCRVLVTACPGHCPALRDKVGTGGVLELHTQTVKY